MTTHSRDITNNTTSNMQFAELTELHDFQKEMGFRKNVFYRVLKLKESGSFVIKDDVRNKTTITFKQQMRWFGGES